MKIINQLISLVVLATASLAATDFISQPPHARNFEVEMFTPYHVQLLEKAQDISSLPEELKVLLASHPDSPEAAKQLFVDFVLTMRSLLSDRNLLKQEQLAAVDELSYYFYTQVNFAEKRAEYMERFFSYPVGCRSTSLEDLIREKWEILESNPDLQGSAKGSHDDKDILLGGFITYRLFEIEGTQFLHLPRPVLMSEAETKIDPIFISYLYHLKSTGKKHLYLSVKSRDQALEQLDASEEFKDTFHYITLYKTSVFYEQKNEYATQSNLDQFKLDLLNWLMTSNEKGEDNYISKSLANSDLFLSLIEAVHNEYFNGLNELSKEDRISFIEIVILKLMAEIRNQIKPDFYNATCVYTMDRGPSQYTLEYFFSKLKDNECIDEKEQKILLSYLLAPSVMAHNRPISQRRAITMGHTADIIRKARGLNSGKGD